MKVGYINQDTLQNLIEYLSYVYLTLNNRFFSEISERFAQFEKLFNVLSSVSGRPP